MKQKLLQKQNEKTMYKKLTLSLLLTLITFAPQSTFAEEATSHIDTNLKNTMIDIMQPITINLTILTKKAQKFGKNCSFRMLGGESHDL